MRQTVVLLALLAGCRCGHTDPAVDAAAPAPSASIAAPPAVIIDATAHPEMCTLGHQGVLLDCGKENIRAQLGIAGSDGLEAIEREGATWERISRHTLDLSFIGIHEEAETRVDGGRAEVWVDARIRGVSAKSAAVVLNGKIIGRWSFSKNETKIVSVHGPFGPMIVGRNELSIRFQGAARNQTDALAEIDWIRIGAEPTASYAAPTITDALSTATVGGAPHRALAIRSPGFLRCSGFLPSKSTFVANMALAAPGSVTVEAHLLRDRLPPYTLGTYTTLSDKQWTSVEVALPPEEGGTLGAIELVARSPAPGVRVFFAEPRILAPPEPKPAVRAASRAVVVVIFSQMPPRLLGAFGGTTATPQLSAFVAQSTSFDLHRATSTYGPASVGSIFTGRLPREHGAVDDATRFDGSMQTIADAARSAGISTAFFTACPTTSQAFGFDRGWHTFVVRSPSDPAVTVFDDAVKWLGEHKTDKALLVVHARGGHPPWDATAEDLKKAPPENYTGTIDPKHAAEILSRARQIPPQVRFNDPDRTRAWTLHAIAVVAHDVAFGKLLEALRETGREKDTTVIVTNDTGMSADAHVPFGDGEPLDDTALTSMLSVRPPFGVAGGHVRTATSSADLARTITFALGLEPPASMGGTDLATLALSDDAGRPIDASLGTRAFLRWGPFVWRHSDANKEDLCVLSLDPACATDVQPLHPIAMEVIRRRKLQAAKPSPRQPATIDEQTTAALRAFGR